MAGKYVPPALRRNQEASSNDATASPTQTSSYLPPSQRKNPPAPRQAYPSPDDPNLYSQREIYEYFWKNAESSPDRKYSTTLHGSAENPDALAFIMLFHGANPKWASDHIIFVKSNLDLLPAIQKPQTDTAAELSTSTPSSNDENLNSSATQSSTTSPSEPFPETHKPFAVFEQPFRGQKDRGFRFMGFFHISRLELLEPNSEALVRMLQKKWEVVDRYGHVKQRTRDKKGWEESMGHKWAVVKMELDDEETKKRGELAIERIEDEEGMDDGKVRKSVNELLQEMRLGKSVREAGNAPRGEDEGDVGVHEAQEGGG